MLGVCVLSPDEIFQELNIIEVLRVLHPILMCGEGFLPTTSSWTLAAGCPTIQLNCDTMGLSLARLLTHKYNSDASPKSCLSPVLQTYWLQIGGFKEPLLGLINLLKWLPELRRAFYLLNH